MDITTTLISIAMTIGLGLVGRLAWKQVQVSRKIQKLTVIVIVLANLLDWAMISALPLLSLSFGYPFFPLFILGNLRGLIVLGITIPLRISQRLRKNPFPKVVKLAWVSFLALYGLLTAGSVYALYIEPFRLGVTRLQVSAPPFLLNRPLRIIHISDTHVERTTRRERDLIAKVNALEPDLILLTGDYINIDYRDDDQAQADTRALLAQLHAPLGVFAILGSVDAPDSVPAIFDGLPIVLLQDETRTLKLPGGDLALIGVTDAHHLAGDQGRLQHLVDQVPPGTYTILLYHTPDLIESPAARGVDLYLAGHTHGGQVRLPVYGAMITFSVYGKRYEMGRYQVNGTTLYVSRGVGLEGLGFPRIRFLCSPEIELIELAPSTP